MLVTRLNTHLAVVGRTDLVAMRGRHMIEAFESQLRAADTLIVSLLPPNASRDRLSCHPGFRELGSNRDVATSRFAPRSAEPGNSKSETDRNEQHDRKEELFGLQCQCSPRLVSELG